jgi:hypothetical protein
MVEMAVLLYGAPARPLTVPLCRKSDAAGTSGDVTGLPADRRRGAAGTTKVTKAVVNRSVDTAA